METPTTLVAKIQHFLINPPTPKTKEEKKAFEDFQVKNGAKFAELIAKYFTKQDERTGEAVLSPSSLGKCTRQLAYKYHGFEGEPFSYETIMTFMTGELLERSTYMLADAVDSPISDIQKQITVGETSGSIDGTVGDIVVDVKSMSDAAFNINHQNGAMDDGFGYLTQMAYYVQGMGKKIGEWITINKNKGTIAVLTAPARPHLVDIGEEKRKTVLNSTPDNLPRRDFDLEYEKKTSRLRLCMQCKFCAFKARCWEITDTKPGWNNSVTYYAKGPNNVNG